MATGIKPVDYEAFLINSAEDEDLAKQLWENLKGRGYRITQHQDPDGPFQLHRDRPVYENMRDAIENSGKLLVLFTKDALTSGYVSLEMILGIEKSLQTRRMGLYLLIVGSNDLGYMTNEEVDSRKHGLLGVVPHLNVNLDQADWAERLLINLREQPLQEMDKLLPVGNLAHGQAFSHYVGYIQYILPEIEGWLIEWKKSEVYKNKPGRLCYKYILLIPQSCDADKPIEGQYPNMTIEWVKESEFAVTKDHGGKKRKFRPTMYRASIQGLDKPIYFFGESAKALKIAWELNANGIATVDTTLEANRFFHTMNNLLNHRENASYNNKARLLCYPDPQREEVLCTALKEEAKWEPKKSTVVKKMTSGLDNLTPNTETYEFDATVTCLSQNAKDNEVAEHIQQYLKAHDQHVVYLEASEGQKQQLGTARWNIFVISKQSFEEAKIKIHPILATDRCAENKCSHILYVITELNMDVIPYSLNWATMINTEQNDYEELILNQIEGMPVHMQQKMPVGDVSTGLAWAYLLNYLHPIHIKHFKETSIKKRIKNFLVGPENEQVPPIPYFYIILSSTGKEVREGDPKYDPETRIINLGKAEQTVTKDQAGTKAREYTINMYKYVRGKDKGKSQKFLPREVCYIAEACTPGITLHTMANREDLQFSGIEEGHILKSQIKTLADVITGEKNGRYIKQYGGFEDFFRLIIYDVDGEETLSEVIEKQLRADCHDEDGEEYRGEQLQGEQI